MRTTFILFLFSFSICFGQMGKVYDNEIMSTSILKGERNYAVYLPPDYDTSQRSYPVLYLLHGGGDDHTGWVQFGEVLHIADEAINNRSATPMIIVMPDGKTGRLGFFNQDEWPYEDYFFEELIPHIEKKYRVKSEKRYRAVAGLSMGGGGSFMYALHRPDMFSSACPLSAYVGPLSFEEFKSTIPAGLSQVSDSVLQNYYERHNAITLVESLPADDIKSVRWYIDCGDDDFLFEGNSLVHIAMTKREIPHEYRVRDGAHNWTYWRESLPEVLKFVSDAFHQY